MPYKYEWIKPGMRVRCIYQAHTRFGKQATVRDVLADLRTILIDWDDNFWGDRSWSYESSFEPLTKRKAKKPAKLKKELEMLEAKPIKRERDISRIYYLRKQCETQ